MTNKTEFAEALECIDQNVYEAICEYKCSSKEVDCDDVLGDKTVETIKKALRIADKLMQEPSDEMYEKGGGVTRRDYSKGHISDPLMIFEAMRDQLIKELDESD